MKILEGTISNIPPKGGRKHPEQSLIPIDTSNILFICGGSFSGLEDIIERRVGKGSLGFERKDIKLKNNMNIFTPLILQEDLIQFGLIPELIGRLPVLTSMEYLTKDELLKILVEPKNAIVKQYQKLFELENVDLVFHQSALKAVVDLAIKRNTGARALRSVMEESLLDIMYMLPDTKVSKIVITKEVISGKVPTEFSKLKLKKKLA